ncbi:MAG: hypothetical protein DDG60_00810 [Anaerolineae bacterium]|nr:MAG: hypothetical protein DDG60_00810 [Anaerolineae bacterium]
MMRLSTRFRFFACDTALPTLMPDLSEFMTVKIAAQELGITEAGVRRLIKIQKLEALPVGKIYLVSRKSVKEYLDQTRGMSKNDPTRGKIQKKE